MGSLQHQAVAVNGGHGLNKMIPGARSTPRQEQMLITKYVYIHIITTIG